MVFKIRDLEDKVNEPYWVASVKWDTEANQWRYKLIDKKGPRGRPYEKKYSERDLRNEREAEEYFSDDDEDYEGY